MQKQHFISIHYLRGLAAVLVCVFHIFSNVDFMPKHNGAIHWMRGGVDIFFVISGFVMVQSTDSKDTSPKHFLLQRCRRIVPLYWIATLAAMPRVTGEWYLKICSLLFIPAMNPKIGMMQPVLEPGWTLNYEMFFYVLFAASLVLAREIRIYAVSGVFVALVLAGFIFDGGGIFGFYTRSIILEFLFGMAIARFGIRLPIIAAPIGFAAMIAMQFFELDRLISLGLPAAVIVASFLSAEDRMPSWKWANFLGSASYSIYLFHLIALGVLVYLWPIVGKSIVAFTAVTLVGMVLMGCGVYWFLERPMLQMFSAKRPETGNVQQSNEASLAFKK